MSGVAECVPHSYHHYISTALDSECIAEEITTDACIIGGDAYMWVAEVVVLCTVHRTAPTARLAH